MQPRDLLGLLLLCLVWGFNFVVAKWSVAGTPALVPGFDGAPPLFFAFLRFAGLALILAPWLRPLPTDWTRLLGVALCMGCLQYALLFIGLTTATPSGMAIAVQMGVPFASILSVVWLGERLGVWRVAGTAAAVSGVILVVADPSALDVSLGLLAGVGAAFVAAVGIILVKRIAMKPMRLQAWIGMLSWPPLLLATLLFEQGQIESVSAGGGWFLLSLFFTIVVVNVFGHGVFYHLVQRYEATLVAPMTLLAPLIGVICGVMIAGDSLGWKLVVGGALTLAGVAVVAARPNRSLSRPPVAP